MDKLIRILKIIFNPEKIIKIFKNPQLHRQEFTILLGVGILLLFVLIVLFYLIFIRIPKRKKPKGLTFPLIILGISLLAFIILTTFIFRSTSKSSWCLNCHDYKQEKNFKRFSHRRVPCLSCHKEPGVVGYLKEKVKMINRVAASIDNQKLPNLGRVTNSSCYQCHQNVENTFVSNRIRINHSVFLMKGIYCTSCHQLDHRQMETVNASLMSTCFPCHLKKKMSNCFLCHSSLGKTRAKQNILKYPKVNLP